MVDLANALNDRLDVLLMDRDPLVRTGLRRRLETEGFRTLEAPTGKRAIEIAHDVRLHVLVMDLEMPRISGLDVYRIIKTQQRFVPCIFTGAHIDQRVRASALAAKAFSVIPKPLDVTVFSDIFHRLLRKYYRPAR